jgi:hypothetical protein
MLAWTFPGSLNNGEQSQLYVARRQRADVQQARKRRLRAWRDGRGRVTAPPFTDSGGNGTPNCLRHDEFGRDRRLREARRPCCWSIANQHLKDVIVAALETGMRKAETLSMQWKQVRFLQNDLYLPGAKTKARRDRQIPISAALRLALTRRQYGMTKGPKPQRVKFGPDHYYAFGNEAGEQIRDVKMAWEMPSSRLTGSGPDGRPASGGLSVEGSKSKSRPSICTSTISATRQGRGSWKPAGRCTQSARSSDTRT